MWNFKRKMEGNMEFKVIGSGGCTALPRPLCKCRVCTEAREKGRPYSRFGCCVYFKELNLIIDTPEDIVQSINCSGIDKIDRVLYSHVDPDHTLGMRVFEQLNLDWLKVSEGQECENPIEVIARENVMEELNSIRFCLGSYLDYYESVRRLIKRRIVNDSIEINNIRITLVPVGSATVFVFEEDNKKLIYAPCDVKPFPEETIFNNADMMIIGNTIIGTELKDGFILREDNPLKKELFVMEDIVALKDKYNIKEVIMIHLEEDWGKSYDDYLKLEKNYTGIKFAYDGMEIKI